eukprot:5304748-Pyramimonas_sp.AAC.1
MQGAWSRDLAHAVLRCLAGTADKGHTVTTKGYEGDLIAHSDAGFAGADTTSQNGLAITRAGS